MKKRLLIFGVCSVFLACNSSDKSAVADDTTTEKSRGAGGQQLSVDTMVNHIEAISFAGSEEGKQLISKSDCLGCHKLNEKLVGPSFADVAKKYEANDANLNLLASKVVNGGAGAWGEVPMSPHPAITQKDAKEMVKYILSLK